MPGPFPGMDPYLESREQWPVVHAALIYCCFAALNKALPAGYLARMEERIYLLDSPRSTVSDIAVIRRPDLSPPAMGGTGVLERPRADATESDEEAPMLLRAERPQVRERYVNVVVVGAPGRVITTIEVLSPANKRPGAGREEYLRKQAATLDSDTHLLEIDLLREGEYAAAAPASGILREHGPWHYAVSLHRAGQGDLFEAWARTVRRRRRRLPRELRVPLDDGRPDVPLDLQAALDRAYDEGRFADGIDYAADPVPPLSAEDAAWADALLREKGLRA